MTTLRLKYLAPILMMSILAAPAAGGQIRNVCSGFDSPPGLFGGPIVIDPDLDLPANPTIDQQIVASQQLLDRLRENDQTLDRDTALSDYFNGLIRKLLAAQEIKPPYPIVAHVSTGSELNAYASCGGMIVVYSRIFEEADNEAQLVAILGHELSHEIHNDFIFFWNAAKNETDSYGNKGLLEQSQAIEQRADLEATRMMYGAGWDPNEQVKMMIRMAKYWQNARGNHRVFYSTHPDDPARIDAVRKLIATFPLKSMLIVQSPEFENLKRSY